MSSFSGKVYAITGAASGIGLAIATSLAKKGATVSLSDVNVANLDKAVESLEGGKGKHMTAVVDVRKSSEVDTWIAGTVSRFGQLDGAANMAGIGPRVKPIREITDEEFKMVNEINVQGMFHSLRAELKNMKNGGAIVNACSVAGLSGSGGSAEYVASKHGESLKKPEPGAIRILASGSEVGQGVASCRTSSQPLVTARDSLLS